MAIVFDGPVTPDAVTTFVRQVPSPSNFTLGQYLPDRYFTNNTINFANATRTNRTARFRAFDARLHVSKRDTISTSTVTLPPLSSSVSTGEFERLQLEFARTQGTNNAALINAIYDDATNLTREIQARMQQAIGDVLTDGKFTLAGEGNLYLEADFGVPSGHLVTAGTTWATTSTDIPADLISWSDTYAATNGVRPGRMLTSLRVQRLMQKNDKIIAAVHGSLTGRTRVNLNELNDYLLSEGLPVLESPYDTVVDVDGTTTRVIPDDKVIFTPANPGDLGYTAWGVSATALELTNAAAVDLSFNDAPGIVGVVEKTGPPYREFVYVDAVGMPVLSNPNALFVADVVP